MNMHPGILSSLRMILRPVLDRLQGRIRVAEGTFVPAGRSWVLWEGEASESEDTVSSRIMP